MPIYVYQCSDCDFRFETIHGMNDEILKTCPSCQLKTLEKLISPPHIIVKGTNTPCNGGDKSKKSNKEKFIPFWRESDKINKNVLKNPEKYIHTGET